MNTILKGSISALIPHVDNLYFANELDIFPGENVNNKRTEIAKETANLGDYIQFLEQKGRRPTFDMYAAFQPFNEATKALYPFLQTLQATVTPGDYILNLWDRSGWLTTLLAGLFPQQTIITTWEGNKDILGYKGFKHWTKDTSNIKVMFCDLDKPLPFKDNSIAFSVGMDAFHRFDQYNLITELTRVVKDNGAILFPHVHLSNNEPEPFFERGCKQKHGLEYEAAFSHLLSDTNWEGYVFSEPHLFAENDIEQTKEIPLVSTPNTRDYNGLIGILSNDIWDENSLTKWNSDNIEDKAQCRVILNELITIDFFSQTTIIDKTKFNGHLQHLLDRHPIYDNKIKPLNGYQLDSLNCQILYLSKKGFTLSAISTKLSTPLEDIIERLQTLEQTGLLQILPISEDGHRLQTYIMSQEYIHPQSEQTLNKLWNKCVEEHGDSIALISLQDESEFSYTECQEVIHSIQLKLQQSNLTKGDKILLSSHLNAEAILLQWAAMQLGIITIPIATHLPEQQIKNIISATKIKLAFVDEEKYIDCSEPLQNITTILFDQEEEQLEALYFSEWIDEVDEEASITSPQIDENDTAVILFTSGTTGTPKGVCLTHGDLFRSGRLVTESFHWTKKDNFFAIGGLESMSGLRNSTVTSLHVGAAITIPHESSIGNLFGIVEDINLSKATILGGNPAILHQMCKYKKRIKTDLNSLNTIMCTGNKLSEEIITTFENEFKIDVLNYYGLSETTGICIAQLKKGQKAKNSIGIPVDSITQIVDNNNNVLPQGQPGELRIYSLNIMKGYYENNDLTTSVIKGGWFYTGDIATYNDNQSIELLGRKKNIIKTANEVIVNLDELRDFILNQPFIEDAAVIPHRNDSTEIVKVFIVAKQTSNSPIEELKQVIKDNFGEEKSPQSIQLIEKIPYAQNGKLLTSKLHHAEL